MAKGCLALALFVFRVDADHPHHTFAVDDLALVTDFLYRCSYFHKPAFSRQLSAVSKIMRREKRRSLIAIYNSSAIQVVGRKFHCYLVAGQDADKVLAHLAGH